MNIIVRTASGAVYCRPDTTWERENKDLFVPDEVTGYSYAPVLFARVCKAGKCVGEKFAERYYDSFGFGVLLYVGDEISTGSCYDHSSVLPTPLKDKSDISKAETSFSISLDGERKYCTTLGENAAADICKAISAASKIVSLRIGDYIAIELQQRETLTERAQQGIRFSAEMDGESLFDFNIVF